MNLHGLISGSAPRPAGGDAKAPAPDPEGSPGAFGEAVSKAGPQRLAQGGAGDQPGPGPGQLPAPVFEAADSPPPLLLAGLPAALPAVEIAATAPDAPLPDAASNMPPGAPDRPISAHHDAARLPAARTPAEAHAGAAIVAPAQPTPVAGGPAATPAGPPARATPGIDFAASPGSPGAPASPFPSQTPPGRVSPGANTDAANPQPRAAGETAAPDPAPPTPRAPGADAAVQATPRAAATAGAAAQPSVTATRDKPAADQARARGVTLPDPQPVAEPKPGDGAPGRVRAAGGRSQPAPAALPIWASASPPVGPPIEPGPGPVPVAPELPPAASRGRGPVVRDTVMQALGDSGRLGLAVSSAATAPPPAGAAAAAPPGVAGGAEMARAAAPQITAAIASDPVSGRISLRLDPPELGRVEITLDITDQSLRAVLAAERPATGELLRRHGEILLAQLQQAGFSGIDLQFAEHRGAGRDSSQPGEPPRPAFAGEPDAPPDGDNADRPDGRFARRTTDGLDLRL